MLLSLMRKHAKSWLIKALIAIIAAVSAGTDSTGQSCGPQPAGGHCNQQCDPSHPSCDPGLACVTEPDGGHVDERDLVRFRRRREPRPPKPARSPQVHRRHKLLPRRARVRRRLRQQPCGARSLHCPLASAHLCGR